MLSLHPDSKNYVITQKVKKKKHLVQHQKTLQKKTRNANKVEKVMEMLAIILVAIIAIDGSIKDARRSQTKINILSVIYVNLRKVVRIDIIIKLALPQTSKMKLFVTL